MKPTTEFDLYFSYAQFSIFDKSTESPFLEWDDARTAQGFVRGDSIVAVATLLPHGIARAAVFREIPADFNRYQRVIAVPLTVASGRLMFSNPEALPEEAIEVGVPAGHYRVLIAQRLDEGAKREAIDIFVAESSSSENTSQILVADAALSPAHPLLETEAHV